MNQEQTEELVNIIRSNPSRVVSDLAQMSGLTTHSVNNFLATEEMGAALVNEGLIAVPQGKKFPKWAWKSPELQEKKDVVPFGKAVLPTTAVVVVPTPERTGNAEIDQGAEKSHGYLVAALNAKGKKREELLKELVKTDDVIRIKAAAAEKMQDMAQQIVAANKETIEVQKQLIEAQKPSHRRAA